MQQRALGWESNLGRLRQETTASVHRTPAQSVELYGAPISHFLFGLQSTERINT